MSERGLTRVTLPMLELLLASIESGRLEVPFSDADLVDVGFRGPASEVTAALRGADAAGVATALRMAIAERVHRPPPRLDLVWTGPDTRASTTHDTALVVERLFASARRDVLVGGYLFDEPDILRPLHRVMVERSVGATFFLDIDGGTHPANVDAFATAFIDRWLRKLWTFGAPKPDIYFDPRTAIDGRLPGQEWATMHPKCIVIDDERCLMTSANFTGRAQTRNIEAGVLVDDRAFAGELAGHWRQLVAEGLVTRYRG